MKKVLCLILSINFIYYRSRLSNSDATLSEDAVYRQDTMKDHPKILEFIDRCCQAGRLLFF